MFRKMFPKISSELTSLLIVSLGFMILIPTEDTFKNMQKTIVSSIADDKPGFQAEGYTLTGIKYSVFCISLWFAPYLCQTIGARLTVILSSFGFLYYMASYVIETEWAMYSAVVILGIAEGTLAPPESQYLIDCSKPKNVSRNVGIFFSLQRMMQVVGNIFVYFNFEGKKYIDGPTRRSALFGLMAAIVLSMVSFLFLPKTTKDTSGEVVSFATTIKKSWVMLLNTNMLCMCLTFVYNGFQQSFGDGIYGPSIGFTLAFGNSVKGLVALSGISKSIGSFLGFLYPLLLAAFISNQSYARRLLFFSGVVGQLVTYFIAFMILPDSATFGNTEEKGFLHPNMYVALLGSLLHGFGDSCLVAHVYSFIGDYFRDGSGEGTVLYKCVRNIFVALNYYWCSHLGLHTQVIVLVVMAVVGVIGCFSAEHISESRRNTKSAERGSNKCPMEER